MNSFPTIPKPSLNKLVINDQIQDVDTSLTVYLKKYYRKEFFYFFAFFAIWEIIVIYFFIINFTGLNPAIDDTIQSFLFFTALPLLFIALSYAWMRKKIRHQFYRQFAIANNFTYKERGWLPNKSGSIFKIGRNTTMQDIIEGEINKTPLSLFNYSYTVGSGKSSHTYQKTILEIDFKTPVPPLLLLVDKHWFGDNISNNNLKNVSKITLDEVFEKHFDLFSEKKFEIEALQIFDPDFLNSIYEKYKFFSLDFSETKLYIYASKIITNKIELDLLFQFADIISKKFLNKLPEMRGSILAMEEAFTKTETITVPKNMFHKYNIPVLIFIFILGSFLILSLISIFIKILS